MLKKNLIVLKKNINFNGNIDITYANFQIKNFSTLFIVKVKTYLKI